MTRPYEMAVYAGRNRNNAYEAVIGALEAGAKAKGMTRKDIADAIGRSTPQLSLWLSGPSNWTLDTISDLLRSVDATVDYHVVFDADRKSSNQFNNGIDSGVPILSTKLPEKMSATTIVVALQK